jgi:MoxR-like ATPase
MAGLDQVHKKMTKVLGEMRRVVFGQESILEQLLTCLLAGGHVILEGVPGLGKTLLARTLAKLVDAQYRRIQFTPDLLPSDIMGTNIFNTQTGSFSFYRGPIFTEILLADEINRTPPKSQAALLEAMEEKQVTIDGIRNALPEMFFVMATQNPVEYEGTYPLPETQLDRFMMKLSVSYPPEASELAIIRSYAEGTDLQELDGIIRSAAVTKQEVLLYRKDILKITVRDEIVEYIRKIVAETRDPVYVQLGGSPRAAVAVLKASRALSAIRGSEFVTPDEVKEVAVPVLRHRVILRPEALIDGLLPDHFVDNILRRVPVPR